MLHNVRCVIPGFDGAIHMSEWKETLWGKFVTGAQLNTVQWGHAKHDPERAHTGFAANFGPHVAPSRGLIQQMLGLKRFF